MECGQVPGRPETCIPPSFGRLVSGAPDSGDSPHGPDGFLSTMNTHRRTTPACCVSTGRHRYGTTEGHQWYTEPVYLRSPGSVSETVTTTATDMDEARRHSLPARGRCPHVPGERLLEGVDDSLHMSVDLPQEGDREGHQVDSGAGSRGKVTRKECLGTGPPREPGPKKEDTPRFGRRWCVLPHKRY